MDVGVLPVLSSQSQSSRGLGERLLVSNTLLSPRFNVQCVFFWYNFCCSSAGSTRLAGRGGLWSAEGKKGAGSPSASTDQLPSRLRQIKSIHGLQCLRSFSTPGCFAVVPSPVPSFIHSAIHPRTHSNSRWALAQLCSPPPF